MRLLICAGMTGGGVYPALAVLQALEDKTESVLWVGSQSGLEETLLSPFNIQYKSIPGGGVHGINIKKLPGNIFELLKGFSAAKSILNDYNPDIILYTGGYLGVPMALAAKNIPSVVFIPDIEPGLALKVILRNADQVAISSERSLSYLKNKKIASVTGYPLRRDIRKWDRKSGRDHFEIDPSERVLLVFGGSKGAQSINNALYGILNQLTTEMHIIHITGKANWETSRNEVEKMELDHPEKYHPYAFLHNDMGAAFAAADLVVCRAGASTIGELPYFGIPAILVPYPHAWQYQYQNAEYLTKNGGATILKDENLEPELFKTIKAIVDDQNKLQKMSDGMKSLAISNAAERIAELVKTAAKNHRRKN